jgi:Leucine-rich repeat (LRR) protein
MKCYSAIFVALVVAAACCQLNLAGALPLDDPLQCPLHCECSASDTEVLIKCDGVQSTADDDQGLVADLTGHMEGLVTNLDVSRTSIPSLAERFVVGDRNFSLLRVLKLSECEIDKIDPKAFKSASSLEELDLANNFLHSVPVDIFHQHCPNLVMVSLRNNPDLDMPIGKPFFKSDSVQELDLSGCGVTKVSQQSFAKLPSLTFVTLEHNDLEYLHPDAFAQLQLLEEINLSFNLIINVPPNLPSSMQILSLRGNPELNVSSLTDLSTEVSINELDVSQCNIDRLPRDVFYNLRSLITLNISHNHLTNLYSPFVLRQLRYLDLSFNSLSGGLDKNLLTHSPNLETLRLAWNDGLLMPEFGFLGDLTSLYLLDVSGCGMTELRTASVDTLTGLSHLNLSHNALRTLPPHVFKSTPHLSTVDLSYNDLDKIPHVLFEDNKKLRHLYLSHNENLEGVLRKDLLANSVALKTLDISHCSFSNVPEYLPESLNNLNVAGNSIEHPSHLLKLLNSYLTQLKRLHIEDNPWKCSSTFTFLRNALESRGVDYPDGKSWTEYHHEVCKQSRHKMASVPFFDQGQNVMRTHFWSILTFLVTITMCVVLAVSCTVIYRGCKNIFRSTGGRRYRTLSESPASSPSPNRIYKETTVPILSKDAKEEKQQDAVQPVTFSKSFIFPRFPVTESDLPVSYVEGNYHHTELVP